ncbi:sarcosine oxidase subunit gamma [Nitratireductor sp. XY-223]|uniref:sarcosine oxidase subunit gamma n=1 Tax=Nitratireductor sp. XY-223 TaxID=2561926 RepID=UPI0010AAD98B|nr:sarcosine oxidase subunit gamma [Nitratireductor sp. XY-223]
MAEALAARPQYPLEGLVAGSAQVQITPAAPASRLALRARPDAVAPLSKALAVKLPQKPKTSARGTAAKTKSRQALWLGPDEWLVIDTDGADLMAACQPATGTFSAVDVSNRNTAIIVSGAAAEAVISSGCPQDLSLKAFPVGACARTLLGKTEIVLLREEEDVFRVECWRSFSAYAFAFLAEAARDPMV